AVLWHQADQAERERRHGLREQGIADALQDARQIRGELHAQLAKPGGVFPLLDKPSRWQQQIQSARAALQRARDLEAGAEAPLAVALRQEIGALAALLQKDEADRTLALRLEKIRADRSAWVEGKFNYAMALAAYPEAFQKAGLVLRPGREEEDAARV